MYGPNVLFMTLARLSVHAKVQIQHLQVTKIIEQMSHPACPYHCHHHRRYHVPGL